MSRRSSAQPRARLAKKIGAAGTSAARRSYGRALMDHGDQLAQDSLKKNPAKMITLINACCSMTTTGLATDKSKRRNQTAPAT